MTAAIPSAPAVNVPMLGTAINPAITAVIGKTNISTRWPPILSARVPPAGRIAVASTTKPAVRSPASVSASVNSSRRSVGR
jgi:hypothetical protein